MPSLNRKKVLDSQSIGFMEFAVLLFTPQKNAAFWLWHVTNAKFDPLRLYGSVVLYGIRKFRHIDSWQMNNCQGGQKNASNNKQLETATKKSSHAFIPFRYLGQFYGKKVANKAQGRDTNDPKDTRKNSFLTIQFHYTFHEKMNYEFSLSSHPQRKTRHKLIC